MFKNFKKSIVQLNNINDVIGESDALFCVFMDIHSHMLLGTKYPDVSANQFHIDILAADFV